MLIGMNSIFFKVTPLCMKLQSRREASHACVYWYSFSEWLKQRRTTELKCTVVKNHSYQIMTIVYRSRNWSCSKIARLLVACDMFTLNKVQKIRVILGRSENLFSLLQWLSMGKQILKHKKMKKTYIPKIILHNYILYKGDPTYVRTFPMDSVMPLIFTDFQQSTWCRPTSCWKICEYQSHPQVYWESSNLGQITLI